MDEIKMTEVLAERGKQINNLARDVRALKKQNRVLRSVLRNLAAHVSNEAWREVIAEMDAIEIDEDATIRVEQNLGVVTGNFTGVKIDFLG